MNVARRIARYLFAIVILTACAITRAQECVPTAERYAVEITQPGANNLRPVVSGENSFYQSLDNGWVFALERAEEGWQVRLYDGVPGGAVDLTQLTPPLRGTPNPRDLFGWHFRNADNTGPNEGSVNAPQETRAFVISPGLAGTAGLKPSGGSLELGPNDGLGLLKITDYGLRNPVPGERAVMNYVQFEACLRWPRPPEEVEQIRDRESLAYTPVDLETFGACGLDLSRYELDAAYAPRTLGGDFDGDGSIDEAAQVREKATGQRAIALCRAGTWLHLIGTESTPGDLHPGYTNQVEAWHWIQSSDDLPRSLVGFDLPEADGDLLILERIEKEAIAVYWHDGALGAHQLYRYVEP
ncbi:MAG: hypothetical protein AAF184_17930 [Pseudomonadota bacterium]